VLLSPVRSLRTMPGPLAEAEPLAEGAG